MENIDAIADGKVKTMDGKIIDRVDACTIYRQHEKSKNLFFDRKGICYIKDEKGTLRRFPQKAKRERN
ncbi:MAG: hypothetical protein CMF23_17880 [Ignavibacteriae bacterium]|nr:hypothetical protein [Ignavibacteriota bacterium]